MENLLQALADAGYIVRFMPGQDVTDNDGRPTGTWAPGGCTCYIETPERFLTGRRDQTWHAYGGSPHYALVAACTKLQEHMRPGYKAYLELAAVMGWRV